MSVKSELLLNTQNSFQTHAQRGANIVMRGGGSLESVFRNKIEAAKKKINDFDNDFKNGCSCKYYVKNDEYKKQLKKRDVLVRDLESIQSDAYMKFPDKFNKPSNTRGGKRKSRRKKGGGSGFGADVLSGNVMGCNSLSGTILGECGRARNKAISDQDDYGETWIQYNLDWINSTKSEKERIQGLNRLNSFIVNMNERFGNVIFPVEFTEFNDQFKEFDLPILVRIGNTNTWAGRIEYNDDLRDRQNESKKTGGKRKSKRTKRMARKSRRKSRRNQRGGRGRTITYANLDFMANNRLGKMVPHGDAYTNCNTQSGGGYGFTKEGASASETFKGGYPVFTKYEKSNQCGGKRRRRRKSRKSRKSKRKSRRKSRKSRRKRRKSRRRRKRRAGSPPDGDRPIMFGGSSHTYGSPVAVGSKPWATAPLGIQANKPSCYDNYNHYKGL
jgi:hypothetical protein